MEIPYSLQILSDPRVGREIAADAAHTRGVLLAVAATDGQAGLSTKEIHDAYTILQNETAFTSCATGDQFPRCLSAYLQKYYPAYVKGVRNTFDRLMRAFAEATRRSQTIPYHIQSWKLFLELAPQMRSIDPAALTSALIQMVTDPVFSDLQGQAMRLLLDTPLALSRADIGRILKSPFAQLQERALTQLLPTIQHGGRLDPSEHARIAALATQAKRHWMTRQLCVEVLLAAYPRTQTDLERLAFPDLSATAAEEEENRTVWKGGLYYRNHRQAVFDRSYERRRVRMTALFGLALHGQPRAVQLFPEILDKAGGQMGTNTITSHQVKNPYLDFTIPEIDAIVYLSTREEKSTVTRQTFLHDYLWAAGDHDEISRGTSGRLESVGQLLAALGRAGNVHARAIATTYLQQPRQLARCMRTDRPCLTQPTLLIGAAQAVADTAAMPLGIQRLHEFLAMPGTNFSKMNAALDALDVIHDPKVVIAARSMLDMPTPLHNMKAAAMLAKHRAITPDCARRVCDLLHATLTSAQLHSNHEPIVYAFETLQYLGREGHEFLPQVEALEREYNQVMEKDGGFGPLVSSVYTLRLSGMFGATERLIR